MARIRAIKPEAFQSETLAAVSLAAERTMFGLSTQADDRGRHPDKPLSINGAIWPERPDHTAAQLEAELVELVAVGLLCRYVGCDGRKYIHFVTWDRHQKIERPSKTRLPRCPHHPVSVTGKAEDCGVHAKDHESDPCPVLPEPSPNPHRTSGEPSNAPSDLFGGVPEGPSEVNGRSGDGNPAGKENPRSKHVSVSPHRASGEGSSTDLGPWTLDRGPRTVDLPSSTTSQTAADDEPADDTKEPTEQQRAFGIARAWIDHRTASNVPVVGSNPLHMLRSLVEPFLNGGYRDDEIKHALVAINEGIPSKRQLEKALGQRRSGDKSGPANRRSGTPPRRDRRTNYAAMVADLDKQPGGTQ